MLKFSFVLVAYNIVMSYTDEQLVSLLLARLVEDRKGSMKKQPQYCRERKASTQKVHNAKIYDFTFFRL